ncbi:MAG: RNA-binding S4 domain-containing protein [Planctomycetes bacterium]|nr:RNA-binding S4 domain-containing protein [Planctomycetota bacterium]
MPGPEDETAPTPENAAPAARPHITLAQFLKFQHIAGSGGQAKARVRAGGILVDGVEDLRPGRKLFGGEVVTVEGEQYEISLARDEDETPGEGAVE